MAKEIIATLPGRVSHVSLNVGDRVLEDEEALVIEAFKMETPVFVPCDGTVKEVRVKAGDDVDEKQILAVIEEG